MEIQDVAAALAPLGLQAPQLLALVPNEANYRALLFQPQGEIAVSAAGVRHQHASVASQQFGQFLDLAVSTGSELVATPEYAMPWEVLASAIRQGKQPPNGCLWALGCESTTLAALNQLKTDLAAHAVIAWEDDIAPTDKFLDPLAYVFLTSRVTESEPSKLVVLIQFKTSPMGDDAHFEISGMQKGKKIYRFGTRGETLTLLTLICSDALRFESEQVAACYDRALLLHIQLNPKPRHPLFRQYRDRVMALSGDATEIICLNWAKDVVQWNESSSTCWRNVANSAWYLRPEKYDDRDATLNANHKAGLYYTWLDAHRAHALFFSYQPSIVCLEASKVAHIGINAALSRRRGPQLRTRWVWSTASSSWLEEPQVDDGFETNAHVSGGATGQLTALARLNPLATERLLALCSGAIERGGINWHALKQLDSIRIEPSEVMMRLTCWQDTDSHAQDFRTKRLVRCGELNTILVNGPLPPALDELKHGFTLVWDESFPHQNVTSAQNTRATVVYLGSDATADDIERVSKKLAEYLFRSLPENESLMARQRLAVWHTNGGRTLLAPNRFIQYDDPKDESEFDITRER